jgi:hypothetical protein
MNLEAFIILSEKSQLYDISYKVLKVVHFIRQKNGGWEGDRENEELSFNKYKILVSQMKWLWRWVVILLSQQYA